MESKERKKPIPEELKDGTLEMVYGGVQSDVEITNQLLVSDDGLISKYSGTEVKRGGL